ncbi:hypothetical protein [Cellulomonas xiejunii]|uniref:hypothetical protein n=1 Tax=Cellulomonas xiejunii TaxID=2968083 RepID=UPI001D0E5730|nr:hypothetical protein [Cellulomonas xiejunii]MCC2313607.1 hypothetical protein [Cellulomonas xiejunii]
MTYVFDMVRRLEADPLQTDLAKGFTAEVADPAWLLARQWQLGEHHGEDASSPVRISFSARLTPVDPVGGQPHLDPRTTPAEAVVESEPGDFWTAGRRIGAGRSVRAAAAAAGSPLPDDPALLLTALPVPYDVLDGSGPDGRVLWQRRAALGLDESWFGAYHPGDDEPVDLWNPAELAYDATFTAGPVTLSLSGHDGGDLDWYSVDADGALPAEAPPARTEQYPRRVTYPGAPLPRWWQIEDAAVDIGGYPPDRAHLATLLLIDLVMSRSDNWFTFTVPEARAGHIVTLDEVVVHDSFGDTWALVPAADWSLFATDGLGARSLVVWATAATPLVGPVMDEVVIGTDEDANLVWAVEQRLRGRAVLSTDDPPPEPPAHLDASGRSGYAYRPMTRIPPHWHPYEVEEVDGRRRYVQGRAADLSGPQAVLLPEAESVLLIDTAAGGVHPTHQLEPSAIPADGVRVERRAVLARSTTGAPVLWNQRRRQPLLSPPVMAIRFDSAEPVPPATA